ncbi:MAG: hypothetical protein ACI4QZ_08885 [Eubacteriales bacterium]
MYDNHLSDFPRLNGETNDSPRIQRAIDATPNGILCIPKGDYEIASPLFIKNRCSLDMHPTAKLIAVNEMDFVLTYDGNANYHELTIYNDDGTVYDNLGLFICGGDIDGNGKASCLLLANAHHYTLSNITLHNGKKYGLCVGGDVGGRLYELVANNVYCKCTMSGLNGNIGIYTSEHDGHYTDCFVIDYTTGFKSDGSANRLTRCHIWGGTVPPKGKSFKEWSEFYGKNKLALKAGNYTDEAEKSIFNFGIPEMLIDSVAFEINGGINVIDGCFADTATIGYLIRGTNNTVTNCGFFNNKLMGLRNTLAIKNESRRLVVTNSFFTNPTGTDRFYEGEADNVMWANNNVDEKTAIGSYFAENSTNN